MLEGLSFICIVCYYFSCDVCFVYESAGYVMSFSDYDHNVSTMDPDLINISGVLDSPLGGQFSIVSANSVSLASARNSNVSVVSGDGANRHQVNSEGPVYTSYAGTDIVAQMVFPEEQPVTIGELQTLSYSIHRENHPVRVLGHTSPIGFVKSGRTIAGSMIFTVFNNYAFYRLQQYQNAISNRLYPVADMLPPFDMVLTFANEYGVLSKMKIYGITFIDEGGTMSIDDLLTENTYTYMARGIQPLTGYALSDNFTEEAS